MLGRPAGRQPGNAKDDCGPLVEIFPRVLHADQKRHDHQRDQQPKNPADRRKHSSQRIKELFDLNGVKFAVPKVQVAEGEETIAAAAVSNLRPLSTAPGR